MVYVNLVFSPNDTHITMETFINRGGRLSSGGRKTDAATGLRTAPTGAGRKRRAAAAKSSYKIAERRLAARTVYPLNVGLYQLKKRAP